MIALVVASTIYLTGMQAAINAPRDAFRNCLKEASAKAATDKVAGDAYEAYIRSACTAKLATLKDALVGFSVKNGMARKSAANDAEMTIDDYIASSVDHYKYMADFNAPKPAAAAPVAAAATPAPTPAAAPATPK
jgi:hypothetical protein